MKFYLLVLVLLSCFAASAQRISDIFFCGYERKASPEDLCDVIKQRSFSENSEAVESVKEVLKQIGLPQNFVLVSCPRMKNAAAITPKDGLRYIVYDKDFIQGINRQTTRWSSLSILAHEIGHHLCGHTLSPSSSLSNQRQKEIEADEFSGFVLCKMGASLTEAQAAILLLSPDEDDSKSTHPNRAKRLLAIKTGFEKAQGHSPATSVAIKNEIAKSAEQYIMECEELITRQDYASSEKLCSIALDYYPKNSILWNDLGVNQHYLQAYGNAIESYTTAIKYDPEYPHAFYNRGFSRFHVQDYQGTIDDCNRAIILIPKFIFAHRIKGSAKVMMNDFVGACASFKIACDLGFPYACANYKQYISLAKQQKRQRR